MGKPVRRSCLEIVVTSAVAVLSLGTNALNAPTPVMTAFGVALFASLGYVWVRILLGHRVTGIERVAVATGLVLAVPVIGGLALQAVGVPLHRTAWTGLFAAVTLMGDATLMRQCRRTPSIVGMRPTKWPFSIWQIVDYSLAIMIAVGAVGLADAGASIQHYPGFTELWLSPGTGGDVNASLGVSNHQGGTERYRLVLIHGKKISATWNITLPNDKTWQRIISLGNREISIANLYLMPNLTLPYRHVQTSSHDKSRS
jgi:hypothetical protein